MSNIGCARTMAGFGGGNPSTLWWGNLPSTTRCWGACVVIDDHVVRDDTNPPCRMVAHEPLHQTTTKTPSTNHHPTMHRGKVVY